MLEHEHKIVPLFWLTREYHQQYIKEYQIIPIAGYQETNRLRAFKIIGNFSKGPLWMRKLSIPIWEDWKLTAKYANDIEIDNSTNGLQMFDHLDDDEKIQALKYHWYQLTTTKYIIKYFKDHPDLLDRARHTLKPEEIKNTIIKSNIRL